MIFKPRQKRFRAFDKTAKKFIFTGFTILGEVNLLGALEIYKEENKPLNVKETLELVITESTGVMDTKGVEIYEGDIIDIGLREYGFVRWQNEFALFCLDNKNWTTYRFFGRNVISKECTILGNIFENPELIII